MEYVDLMVRHELHGSWPRDLRAFVEDLLNKWCPPWIRNNYEVLSEDASEAEAELDRRIVPETDENISSKHRSAMSKKGSEPNLCLKKKVDRQKMLRPRLLLLSQFGRR